MGALLAASDQSDFYLLSPQTSALARGGCTDFVACEKGVYPRLEPVSSGVFPRASRPSARGAAPGADHQQALLLQRITHGPAVDIAAHARISFRHLNPEARHKAVQEAVCNACQANRVSLEALASRRPSPLNATLTMPSLCPRKDVRVRRVPPRRAEVEDRLVECRSPGLLTLLSEPVAVEEVLVRVQVQFDMEGLAHPCDPPWRSIPDDCPGVVRSRSLQCRVFREDEERPRPPCHGNVEILGIIHF